MRRAGEHSAPMPIKPQTGTIQPVDSGSIHSVGHTRSTLPSYLRIARTPLKPLANCCRYNGETTVRNLKSRRVLSLFARFHLSRFLGLTARVTIDKSNCFTSKAILGATTIVVMKVQCVQSKAPEVENLRCRMALPRLQRAVLV